MLIDILTYCTLCSSSFPSRTMEFYSEHIELITYSVFKLQHAGKAQIYLFMMMLYRRGKFLKTSKTICYVFLSMRTRWCMLLVKQSDHSLVCFWYSFCFAMLKLPFPFLVRKNFWNIRVYQAKLCFVMVAIGMVLEPQQQVKEQISSYGAKGRFILSLLWHAFSLIG